MIKRLKKKVLAKNEITKTEALSLLNLNKERLMDLLTAANNIKNKYQGTKIDLCSIISAKAGNCSEDCSFCAQSVHHKTQAANYSLLSQEEILERAKKMEAEGADHFGIVTSGQGVVDEQEFTKLIEVIKKIKEKTSLNPCASLGTLDSERAEKLAAAGLVRYNHNLETSENYFSEICTTHDYEDRIKTIKLLKEKGVEVCSGGIIGLGETKKDRIDLAFTLKELKVDTVPINILNPVTGTPLEEQEVLAPLEVLKTVAVFRFILPTKVIKLCGGRENNLRDLQSLSLLSGINGLLIGNYLTTEGRKAERDLQMIKDLELI